MVSKAASLKGKSQGKEELFYQLQLHRTSIKYLVALLRECAKHMDLYKGSIVHEFIVSQGYIQKCISIGHALLSMYAKCGALAKAQEIFNEIPVQCLSSWKVLIEGYSQHGYAQEVFSCYAQMQSSALFPCPSTFANILKTCARVGERDKGKEIHVEIIRCGFLGKDPVLGTALVDMYAKCGALSRAKEVFDELFVRDVISWTALVTAYSQNGDGEHALIHSQRMLCEAVFPDEMTYASTLTGCGIIGAYGKGKEMHAKASAKGFLEKDSILGNSLVDMYAKCGALKDAKEAFDLLQVRNIISWTALIAGYSQHNYAQEALNCWHSMKFEGFQPNALTFSCILKACGSLGLLRMGKEIHHNIVRQGLFPSNNVLGTALVDMYMKCGAFDKALEVFKKLSVQNVVSWNVLITGYCQHGCDEDALNCFEMMQCDHVSPDGVTFLSILKVCGSSGASDRGKEIHAEIVRMGKLEEDAVLGTALIDMYAKCGAIIKAQQVFEGLCVQNVESWNALLTGYTQLGEHDLVFELFNKMIVGGTKPDLVTFSIVLSACQSCGLLIEAYKYFEIMNVCYNIAPNFGHHTSMVDIFCRMGDFDSALSVMEKIPSSEYFPMWLAILDACKRWGNMKLARLAFEHVLRLDEQSSLAYMYLIHIFTISGTPDEENTLVLSE